MLVNYVWSVDILTG